MKRALKWFGTSPRNEEESPPNRTGTSTDASSPSDWGVPRAKRPANNSNCYRSPPATVDDRFRSFTPTSPSSLTHASPSSLSPSPPAPATPKSSQSGRPSLSGISHAVSKPIPIATPTSTSFSRSPSATALRIEQDNHDFELEFLNLEYEHSPPNDIDMTAGPNYGDSAMGMGRSRQDSFVSAGPKPISMNNSNVNRGRRESLAGSLMGAGGMSWGGLSVGSFIRDDIMMAGTSPFMTHQSPSFHSSSYIPKLEANFMRDFTCCDRTWPTLHDLLQHYEENHTQANVPATKNTSTFDQNSRASSVRPGTATQSVAPNQFGVQQTQGFQQNRQGSQGVGGFQQMMRQQQQPSNNGSQRQTPVAQMNDDMDALGDMEMDDPVGPLDLDDNQRTIQQTRQLFGQQQRPQLHLNSAGLPQQALRTSQPPTPAAASFGFQNNPTVSSVNTPTLTTHQGLPGRNQFDQDNVMGAMDEDLQGGQAAAPKLDFSNINLGNLNAGLNGFNFNGNGLFGMGTIDEPAKRLYSPGGTTPVVNQRRVFEQQLQQQLQQLNLDPSQLPPGTDTALLLQHMTALMMPPVEEPKPFKCPVIGCEKAYKNQNGLKYHKTHGHTTQQLHENGDGTFSIVNPETSAPYPGTMGMEKEKPFKCDVCGKRYKNLNGLKYHKQHSPMCDPETRLQQQNAMATIAVLSQQNGFAGLNVGLPSHGLPNIGEDSML